jgi:cyanophycin synthetase
VRLASAANLSAGGTATDVTARVHPEVAAVCERAARLVGLDVCGVDLVMPDIGAPDWRAGGIVEVNAAPGIRMHEHPAAGEPRRVGRAIVDALFPSGDGRIPVVAVTGTNGKTSVTRLVGHVLASCGRCVGMTTTDEMIVDGRVVARGDLTGPASAWGILADPIVDVAVLETARGGIMRGGLGWDWADVGVLTNVQLDHIGQDGLRTIDDVMHVKSLVAERVREGGTLVLNADDERVARVPDRPGMRGVRRRVVWFSANPESARVRRHCALGGTAVVARDGWIVERSGDEEHALIALASLPVLQGGVSAFQIPNLLAAVAAVRALGLGRDRVVDALGRVPAAALAGRGSLYALHGGYVLLDYGHNAAAFEAVGRSLAAFPDHRRTALIGLPGDRADWVIEQAGRVAARVFDRLIVRDDADRRGRAEGEVATLLCRAAATATPARPCRVVPHAAEALDAALAEARPGEIVVVFWDEDRGAIDERLRREGATPAAGIAARPRPANRLGA